MRDADQITEAAWQVALVLYHGGVVERLGVLKWRSRRHGPTNRLITRAIPARAIREAIDAGLVAINDAVGDRAGQERPDAICGASDQATALLRLMPRFLTLRVQREGARLKLRQAFGTLLRSEMEARAVTRIDLAESLGISASKVSDVVRSVRPPFDELLCEEAADVLGADLDRLLEAAETSRNAW